MSDSDHTTENWVGLVQFPGYDVSDLGRVRSYWIAGSHPQRMTSEPETLSPAINSVGYPRVTLKDRNRKTRYVNVHRLILECFVGMAPEGTIGRHLNDIKTDNRLVNLAWGSHGDNRRDSYRNGTPTIGQRVARLTSIQVAEIKRLSQAGRSQASIARQFGIHPSHVSKMCSGHRWKPESSL
jgi:HNH endonuclease/NUMOD4 motif